MILPFCVVFKRSISSSCSSRWWLVGPIVQWERGGATPFLLFLSMLLLKSSSRSSPMSELPLSTSESLLQLDKDSQSAQRILNQCIHLCFGKPPKLRLLHSSEGWWFMNQSSSLLSEAQLCLLDWYFCNRYVPTRHTWMTKKLNILKCPLLSSDGRKGLLIIKLWK